MRCAAVILRREFHLEGRAGSVLWSPHWMCHALLLGGVPDAVQLNPKTTTLPQPTDPPLLPVSHSLWDASFVFGLYTLLFTFSRMTTLLQCTRLLLRGSCVLRYLMYEEFKRKKTVLSLSLFMIYSYHEVTTWRNQAGQQHSNVLQTLTIFSVYTAHNIITVIWIWNYANEKGSHDSQ